MAAAPERPARLVAGLLGAGEAVYADPRMSGNVYRRCPATLALVALLVSALAILGIAARTSSAPATRGGGDAGARVAVIQPAVPHIAKRVTARLVRLKAAVASASQRVDSSAATLRALSIVLLVPLGLCAAAGLASRRRAVRIPGVRAPPSGARPLPLRV